MAKKGSYGIAGPMPKRGKGSSKLAAPPPAILFGERKQRRTRSLFMDRW